MFRSRWIHELLGLRTCRKLRRRCAAQTRKPVRPVLESLEERVTPNATVTQTAGSYSALNGLVTSDTAANTDYVINITGNFTFNTGQQITISQLSSSSTLTIQGQNGTNHTLTGNGNRLFTVNGASQHVTLNHLTLTGGSGVTNGGALVDQGGDVTLNSVTIQDNTVTGTQANRTAEGGGVFLSGGGTLAIKDSSIKSNVAQGFNGTTDAMVTPSGYVGNAGAAIGGGLFVSGGSTVQITASTLSDNSAQGGAGFAPTTAGGRGGSGGTGAGGGLLAFGSFSATLTGVTVSENSATGGAGGDGADAVNGVGGKGGNGGNADGGGLYVGGSGTLTILNDLAAPLDDPSLIINNTAQGSDGGTGGKGGPSANGGSGGGGGRVFGGGLFLNGSITANIGNTAFYGNSATGGNGKAGGLAGQGGAAGSDGSGDHAFGGGLYLGHGTFTLVNNTVAKNSAVGGTGPGGNASATGGGIYDNNLGTTATLANNTITQNSVSSTGGVGGGIAIVTNADQAPQQSDPALFNNLIQNNSTNGSPDDLASTGGTPTPLTNATNNFISAVKPVQPVPAVNTATNIVGTSAAQLGSAVGVDSGGNSTGGPVYYPLLSGVASVGAGTTAVLSTIAAAEGHTPAFDAIGALRSTDGTTTGSISLGAVQPLFSSVQLATTIIPADATVAFYGANPSPAFQVSVEVNVASGGTAVGGTLSLTLNANNNSTLLGSAVVGANGVATVSVPAGALPANLQAGDYQLVETYSGTAAYAGNNAVGTLMVNATPTTSILPGDDTVPAGSAGVTFDVGVSSPGGQVNAGSVSVQVLVNGSSSINLGSFAVVNGVATVTSTLVPSSLPIGTYQIKETFSGAANFQDSTGFGTLTVTTDATTVVGGNASLNFYGASSPAFTVVVPVNSPEGKVSGGTVTVSLVANNTTSSLGSASVTNGKATLAVAAGMLPANLQPGSYQLIESYSGSTPFASSSGTGTLTITTSTTSVAAGNSSVNLGSSSPFTISVGVNSPSGTVNGGSVTVSLVSGNTTTTLGTATVSGGVASVSVSAPAALAAVAALPTGSYQLVETYTPAANGPFAGSTANGTLTVTTSATTVAAGNAGLAYFGSTASPAFQVVVGVNSSAGTVTTGSVSLSLVSGNTTTALGTANMSANGTATVSVAAGALPANLPPGTYDLIETYTDVAGGQFGSATADGTLTISASPTLVVAGNAGVDFFDGTPSPAFSIAVGVNSPAGVVTGGTVTVSLVSGNTTTTLGTANVSGGTASVSVAAGTLPANLQPGTYQLVETYSGNPPFTGASAFGTLTINNSAATSVVAGNGNVNYFGGSPSPAFQLVAAVNSSAGTVTTGSVSFTLVSGNTTTPLGVATVSGGRATLSVAAGTLPANLQAGTYQVVETYTDVAGGKFGSSSAAGTLAVVSTTTTVMAGDASIRTGSGAPFTIGVGVNSPNGTVNSGTVTVSLIAGNTTINLTPTPVAVSGGLANVTVTDPTALAAITGLQAGTYTLVESYTAVAGGPFGNASADGTLTLSSAATTVIPGNASVSLHSQAPFTIAVGVNSPAGTVNSGTVTVSLVSGGITTTLGTGSVVSGTASVSVAAGTLPANLQPGSYQLVETYSGNPPFTGASALGILTVVSSSTTVVAGNAGVNLGSTSPFTVSVAVNSPNGTVNSGTVTVSLVSGNTTTTLGTANVSGGVASVSVSNPAALAAVAALPTGTYQLNETYTGAADSPFPSSSAFGTLTVSTASTTVVPGSAGITAGSTTPFTIAVGVNSPAGTVNGGTLTVGLVNGATTLPLTTAPVSVSGGVATVSVSDATILSEIAALPAGTYQLVESYSRAAGGAFASSSAFGTLTASTASTTVVPGSAGITAGSTTPFTIAVGVNSPSGTVNGGTVTVSLVSGATTLPLTTAPVSVSGGVATVSVSDATILGEVAALPAGTYQLVENYSRAAGGAFASSSAFGTLTVNAVATASTSVVPGDATIGASGGTTTVTALVNSPAGAVNRGTVTVSLVNGGTSIVVGSAQMSDGAAIVGVALPANLAPGNYTLIETYADGSGHFNGSSALGNLSVEAPLAPPATPPVPLQVAVLELALDAAALALQGNPAALLGLNVIDQLFLHESLPATVPDLLAEIATLYPQTGSLGLQAVESGLAAAGQLQNSGQ